MSVIPLEFEASCGQAVVVGSRAQDGWTLTIQGREGFEANGAVGKGWAASYEEAVDAAEKLARVADAAMDVDVDAWARSKAAWALVGELTAGQRLRRPPER